MNDIARLHKAGRLWQASLLLVVLSLAWPGTAAGQGDVALQVYGEGGLLCAAYSPTGKQIVTGSEAGLGHPMGCRNREHCTSFLWTYREGKVGGVFAGREPSSYRECGRDSAVMGSRCAAR